MLADLESYDWAEVFGEESGGNCGKIEPRRIPGETCSLNDKRGTRLSAGVCINCGHNPCTCRIPKRWARYLPVGITRKGTIGLGHPPAFRPRWSRRGKSLLRYLLSLSAIMALQLMAAPLCRINVTVKPGRMAEYTRQLRAEKIKFKVLDARKLTVWCSTWQWENNASSSVEAVETSHGVCPEPAKAKAPAKRERSSKQ